MSEDEAFLRAIWAEPDDDGPRLVYADWLEENGQPQRAEFIRVQCELGRPGVASARRKRLRIREQELLEAHRRQWLGKLRRSPLPWVFHRGFVERLGEGGVFHAGPFHFKDEHWCQYLRFFPDGRVLYGAFDPPLRSLLEVQRRLQRGKRNVLSGPYTLHWSADGVAVRFRLLYEYRKVVQYEAARQRRRQYEGTIRGSFLRLKSRYGTRGAWHFRAQYRWAPFKRRL
jgi:uncharacterized protein (TIGR02996 family)